MEKTMENLYFSHNSLLHLMKGSKRKYRVSERTVDSRMNWSQNNLFKKTEKKTHRLEHHLEKPHRPNPTRGKSKYVPTPEHNDLRVRSWGRQSEPPLATARPHHPFHVQHIRTEHKNTPSATTTRIQASWLLRLYCASHAWNYQLRSPKQTLVAPQSCSRESRPFATALFQGIAHRMPGYMPEYVRRQKKIKQC